MKKIIAIALVLMMVLCSTAMAETLKMVTNVSFPPYEYYDDETGEPTGIDVEIAAAICEKLGYELEIVDIDFASIIPSLTNGKADFSMAGMTVTEERKQSVDFSNTYATGIQAIIVPEDSPITCADDLFVEGANYTVGVQEGTTGDIYISGDLEDTGLGTVQRYKNGTDATLALTSGKIDCVIIDNEPAKQYVAANEGLKILDTAYIVEDYAAALPKDSALTEQFNAALQELIDDGTVAEIIGKYIKAE